MSNEIMKQENQLENVHKTERNIEVVTTEIKTLCEQARALALSYAIEIGRRLDEAKGMLSHGEWSDWLKNEVDFSQSTANNYMKLFEEYGDMQISIFGAELKSQTLGNLSYTKALKLLSIPAEEREDFVSDNNVEDMSVRDLDKLIKERDEAIARAEALEDIEREKEDALKEVEGFREKFNIATDEINALNEKLEKAKTAEKKAKEKVKELKENPTISDDVMKKITADAEAKAAEEAQAEIEKQVAEVTKKLEDALKEKESAETNLTIAQSKVSELEKKIQLSDPKVTEFKTIFEQVQSDLSKLDKALEAIEDNDIKEKLSKAIAAVVGKYIVKEV